MHHKFNKPAIILLLVLFLPSIVLAQQTGQMVNTAPAGGNWIQYAALALAILGAFISIYCLTQISKSKGSRRLAGGDKAANGLAEIKAKIKHLSNEMSKKLTVENLEPLREQMAELEAKIALLTPKREVEWTVTGKKKPEQTGEAIAVAKNSKKNEPEAVKSILPELIFAKLPDLANGFSAAVVSPVQNGEQVYEIKILGDNGTFSISKDANAQKYALSEYNYFLASTACDLLNQPSKNSAIYTVQDGELLKIAGDWMIQKKATIEFR